MSTQQDSPENISAIPVIHRGAWVVAGYPLGESGSSAGIIEDGGLVVADGLIRDIGPYKDIARQYGHYPTHDHEGRVLTPALINGHCHLELSHLDLADNARPSGNYSGDPTVWIKDLLRARDAFAENTTESATIILNKARQMLQVLHTEGVAFVGDVGNFLASRHIGDAQKPKVSFLLEILGLTQQSESKAFARLADLTADKSLTIPCTPHAPYSTTPALIRAIKKQAEQLGHIVSIHVAESEHEVEFLRHGSGAFGNFLVERQAWDNSFIIPGKGPVQYLDDLGVLNDKTLCVHAVHVAEDEIALLAKRKASVCLCPGSNRFLGVGKAPVTEFLGHGILPALGTDSKASNEVLSMWREMRLLREDHPGLAPEAVFAMATLGGAKAWRIDNEIGTLAPGRRALILAVEYDDTGCSAADIIEYLTSSGDAIKTEWLE